MSTVARLIGALLVSTSAAFSPLPQKRTANMTPPQMAPIDNICPEISTTPKSPSNEVAVLASGWFWHPQRDFRSMGGVADCVVGYTGGKRENPTYQNMKDTTEAFMVEFDPSIISYEKILDEWADQHAPYYPSKCQYRSAIFYCSEEQRHAGLKKIEELGNGGTRKVCVDLEPVSTFYRGEEYHQDFLQKQVSARAPQF